ncbi:MAG: histidine phosphatase family protein [Paracoccaceae bacterium]
MDREVATELTLIRHAPTQAGGRLAGRRDVEADLSDLTAAEGLRKALPQPRRLIISPARRCQQTAAAIWPVSEVGSRLTDPRLWEQDFGLWEGLPYADLPDLGPLTAAALADYRPPGGESFTDLCARIAPALEEIAEKGSATIVAHAGTIRAALALALGTAPAALAFGVSHLSATRIQRLPGGTWSVSSVNWTPAG